VIDDMWIIIGKGPKKRSKEKRCQHNGLNQEVGGGEKKINRLNTQAATGKGKGG